MITNLEVVMSYNFCSVHENMFTKKCSVCEYQKSNPKCNYCKKRECICSNEVFITTKLRRNDEIETFNKDEWNKKAKKSNSRISKRFA